MDTAPSRAEHLADGPARAGRWSRLVDHRRDAPDVGDLGPDAVRREDLLDQLADQVLGVGPGDRVEHPQRAGGLAARPG